MAPVEIRRPMVLIVEDEFQLGPDAADCISAFGFEVVETGSADELLGRTSRKDGV
jgi:hypothetical protein